LNFFIKRKRKIRSRVGEVLDQEAQLVKFLINSRESKKIF